jgi:hypothetical protein
MGTGESGMRSKVIRVWPLARLWGLHPLADLSAYEGTLISLPQGVACICTQGKTDAEKIGEGTAGGEADPRALTHGFHEVALTSLPQMGLRRKLSQGPFWRPDELPLLHRTVFARAGLEPASSG